jgi:hypothetical protein
LLGSLALVSPRKAFYIIINNSKEIDFREHFISNQQETGSVGIVAWLQAGRLREWD